MDRNRTLFSDLVNIVKVLLYLGGLVLLFGLVYAAVTLGSLRSKGVYRSAEEGMLASIERGYTQPDQVEIIYAGPNSFDGSDPNVWYVIACIWGGTRANGDPVGSERHVYDQPGHFFLATRDGWVMGPESTFPTFLGFWMRVYGLALPRLPTIRAPGRSTANSSDPFIF